jgi:hypothetical protein
MLKQFVKNDTLWLCSFWDTDLLSFFDPIELSEISEKPVTSV